MGLGSLLFGFRGRIRRTTYWVASIGVGIALGVIGVILVTIAAGLGFANTNLGDESRAADFGGLAVVWLIPVYLVGFWVSLALGVKRCHDRNYPGVVILLAWIPILGWLWALIDLGFIDGTPGPNQYGPSPKGIAAPAAAAAA
ncbi:MAG TPA: DUF805 domain-containing protein [Caulobacteraceae bacterium]|nr:DUF805 domain-containing protein [Caulobacteraceae bacterium]